MLDTPIKDRLELHALPEPIDYYASVGLVFRERAGKWRTTRCEFHGGSDSMRVNTQTGAYVCMACGARGGDVLDYERAVTGADFATAARALGCWAGGEVPVRIVKPQPRPEKKQRTSLSDWGRELWAECRPISGIAADYLRARCCLLPPADGDLRWHPALKHPSGYVGPAMVGLVTHAATNEPLSLHRTWIRPDGRKADVAKPKLLLAGHALDSGVIRLWPDEAVTYGLGIAEGIETALSLAHVFQSVWAALDVNHLAKFSPLPGIESLTIAADNDERQAGQLAAQQCAAVWAAAGREVFIRMAPAGDVNDALEVPA